MLVRDRCTWVTATTGANAAGEQRLFWRVAGSGEDHLFIWTVYYILHCLWDLKAEVEILYIVCLFRTTRIFSPVQ
jgi:hypothetical protein